MSDDFDEIVTLESILASQEALIADYQQKALQTTDAQRCNLWAVTIKELISSYFQLLNKDQKIMALSQSDLDLVLASIKDNGAATAKVVELQAAIAAKTAELTAFQDADVTEDADYEARIAALTTSLQEDQAQLDSIKAALVEAGTPVVEPPVTPGFR